MEPPSTSEAIAKQCELVSKSRRHSAGLRSSSFGCADRQDRRHGIHSRDGLSFLSAIALALPSAACGQPANDTDFARYVASDVKKDCLSALPQAPNDAARQQLTSLCDCTEKKILATPMGRGDNDQSVNAKVHAAMNACVAEVEGPKDEKR